MNSVINFLDSGDVLGKRGLVDNNGKSLRSRYLNGEISRTEYNSKLVKKKGYKDYSKYLDRLAEKKGYKSHSKYCSKIKYRNGECAPFNENKECPLYLGVHIAERILPLIFRNVERMSINNSGYDYICNKDYKIDVKSSSLGNSNQWMFSIRKNKIADYFLMTAFDNRDDLNIINIWLIEGNEIVRGGELNSRVGFGIRNSKKSFKKLKEYEIIDKLDDIQKVCNEFREAN